MKTMKKTGDCIRQGDVMLRRITKATVTDKHQIAPRIHGSVVVAEGESSGHVHEFRDPGVCMLVAEGISMRVLTVTDECEMLCLGTGPEPRHPSIRVPPGTYEIVIQRQWSGEQIQNVAD